MREAELVLKSSLLNFRDKTAVITGAGSGIGRALAQALASRGCHLALADINQENLAATAVLVAASGIRVSIHELDVASRELVADFPNEVIRHHSAIDLLFNNAGVAVRGRFLETTEADFDWLFEINFHGVVRMTRAFLPMLLTRSDAHIVNIASLFSIIAPAGQTHYSASKFAVRGFSDALRHELKGTTVGVSTVCPGGVATSIASSARFSPILSKETISQQLEKSRRLLRKPPAKAAEIILAGVERRRPRVMVGADARFGCWLERLLPVTYGSLLKSFEL
ncbi:MAG: SDR family oxidoreductase [Gammaproteobacteria bacterium]|nr:SDR family oxidoreductase [Gammaproteobacteria bacterium]